MVGSTRHFGGMATSKSQKSLGANRGLVCFGIGKDWPGLIPQKRSQGPKSHSSRNQRQWSRGSLLYEGLVRGDLTLCPYLLEDQRPTAFLSRQTSFEQAESLALAPVLSRCFSLCRLSHRSFGSVVASAIRKSNDGISHVPDAVYW
jgi:hypothetical protein